MDQASVDQLVEEISRRYPYPLAATYHRALDSNALSWQYDALRDLLLLTLRYLASVMLSEYLGDTTRNDQVNRALTPLLNKISEGHWQGWLRHILNAYGKQPIAVSEVAAFYGQKHRGNSELLRAYNSLRAILHMHKKGAAESSDKSKEHNVVTTEQFFNLVIEYRNFLVAHSVTPNEYERERMARILIPAINRLFAEMEFVTRYKLVYLTEVKRLPIQKKLYDYSYIPMMGYRLPKKPQVEILGNDDPVPGRVYLLAAEGGFKPLLELDPFIVYRSCELCGPGRQEVFMLNSVWGKNLDYLSYQCGHHSQDDDNYLYLQERLQSKGVDISAQPAPSAGGERSGTTVTPSVSSVERDAHQDDADELRQQHEEQPTQLQVQPIATQQAHEDAARKERERAARVISPVTANQLKLAHTLTGHTDWVRSVAYSPDGQTIASGSDDNTIKLWRVSDGTEILTLTRHTYAVFSVAYSPDGQTLAFGSSNNTIKLWRVSDGAYIRTLTGHSDRVNSVAYSPDGQILASGSSDQTIKLWRVSDGAYIRTLTGHSDRVNSVAYSPDGQILASGSYDNTIKLWGVSDGAHIRTFTGHTDWVFSVAYSPDGQILASGSYDGTIKLWRVSDGAYILNLTRHSGAVHSVAYSPDGQTIASGSSDQTIKLWRVSDGARIFTLISHINWVNSVAYSPDGQILASGSYDGTIKLWRVGER
jgi:WD40 repeat protein